MNLLLQAASFSEGKVFQLDGDLMTIYKDKSGNFDRNRDGPICAEIGEL